MRTRERPLSASDGAEVDDRAAAGEARELPATVRVLPERGLALSRDVADVNLTVQHFHRVRIVSSRARGRVARPSGSVLPPARWKAFATASPRAKPSHRTGDRAGARVFATAGHTHTAV